MAHVVLTAEDQRIVAEWLRRHDATCPIVVDDKGVKRTMPDVGMLGARLSYSLTPSNLGWLATVTCSCGCSIELPDDDE